MAKKNKQQKRKDKLKARKASKQIHSFLIDEVFVDKKRIEMAFPDIEDRLNYVRALQVGL